MVLLLLAIFGGAAVVLITVSIRFESGVRVDADVLQWIQDRLPESSGKRRKKIDTMMRDVTAMGGDTATVLLALCGSAALIAQGSKGALWPFLLTLGLARGTGWILKKAIRRPRPAQAGHALDIFTSSFPSVHTAMGFVSTFAIMFFLAPTAGAPGAALAVASFVSALIGLTRLYFAVHWPLDVLAGWFAGLTIAATSTYLLAG